LQLQDLDLIVSEHLLEMAGARVRVRDGEVEVLTEPAIRSCPLRRDLYGIDKESKETVKKVLEEHMAELGMYGPRRVLELENKPVSFGASEILFDALTEGLVDAAVLVCEGAGTVVAAKPEVLQAIGAHMTGLVRTEPIEEIQMGLEDRGCILIDRQGRVDQIQGFERAAEAGYRRIAVTVAGHRADEAFELRKRKRAMGAGATILAVHTTGISISEAQVLAECCDLVWSCASRAVREVVGGRALMQIGIAIPVFALTPMGKRLILNRAMHFDGPLLLHRAGLPLMPEGKQPEPLV
jgi:putative methanogenesis marker protein 8